MNIVSTTRNLSISIGLCLCAWALIGCTKTDPLSETSPTATSQATDILDKKVTSSESNLIKSMLYRWWHLFESPGNAGHDIYFDQLFTENLNVSLGPIKMTGVKNFKAAFDRLPDTMKSAHHVENIEISVVDETTFALTVDFTFDEINPATAPRTMRTRYKHLLEKQADQSYRFKEVTAEVIEALETRAFQDSFISNRVKASVNHYLGTTDELVSDYKNLNLILTDTSEIHGMFDPEKVTFNERGDGILRGQDEIANWLASRKETFKDVAHDLTKVTVTPLDDKGYLANVVINTQAWPKAGGHINVDLPVNITLRDTGNEMLTIEKIER